MCRKVLKLSMVRAAIVGPYCGCGFNSRSTNSIISGFSLYSNFVTR